MNGTYYKHWSAHLGREMELKVYGHAGKPLLAFPSAAGRFYDFEDFGMVDTLRGYLDAGRLQVYAVDGVDAESWLALWKWPGDRAWQHELYDRYIVQEVAPFIREHSGWQGRFMLTGSSMGAYHAANCFFRHPDVFDTTIALSGLYGPEYFVGSYRDEHVAANFPLLYLPQMDLQYLEAYRCSRIIICVGQGAWEELHIRETRLLQQMLAQLQIPAWVDYWGYDVDHDWPWWRRQLPYFVEHCLQYEDSPPWSQNTTASPCGEGAISEACCGNLLQ